MKPEMAAWVLPLVLALCTGPALSAEYEREKSARETNSENKARRVQEIRNALDGKTLWYEPNSTPACGGQQRAST